MVPIIIGTLLIFAGKGFVVVKKRAIVADAELAVLKVLWARGPLTAKTITEAIYPDGAESEFAAVHSFLQRLERKGLITRDRSSFVHVFSPTASHADILGQELKAIAERLGRLDRTLDYATDQSETAQQKRGGGDSQAARQIPKMTRGAS